MASVAVRITAARTELEAVETFLRKRYHYPHPIFEPLAAAKEHLAEAAVEAAKATPAVESKTEETPVPAGPPQPEATPIPTPKPKATRTRGKRGNG